MVLRFPLLLDYYKILNFYLIIKLISFSSITNLLIEPINNL